MSTFHPEQSSAHQAFWQGFYEAGNWPWDLGEASPHFKHFLESPQAKQFPRQATLLVPGSGRGHDAVLFSQYGHAVTCVDYANGAPEAAQAKYPDYFPKKIAYHQRDFFSLIQNKAWKETFDGVIEHTCFCAIPRSRRKDYQKTVTHLIKPNGYLLGVFWEHNIPDGPPFSTTIEELQQLFSPNFSLRYFEACPQTAGGRNGTEYLMLWQKAAS